MYHSDLIKQINFKNIHFRFKKHSFTSDDTFSEVFYSDKEDFYYSIPQKYYDHEYYETYFSETNFSIKYIVHKIIDELKKPLDQFSSNYKDLERDINTIIHFIFYSFCKKVSINDNDLVRIKFKNEKEYLTEKEVVKRCKNYLLNSISVETKYRFLETLIFNTKINYKRTYESDYILIDGELNIHEGNINYNLFVYFIQNNINNLSVDDLNESLKINFLKKIDINLLFDNKTDTKKQIDEMFKNIKQVKINNSEHSSKYNRLKRLFCINYIITYVMKTAELKELYINLYEREHFYSNYYDKTRNDSKYNVELSIHRKQIKNDLNVIEKIKEINIET